MTTATATAYTVGTGFVQCVLLSSRQTQYLIMAPLTIEVSLSPSHVQNEHHEGTHCPVHAISGPRCLLLRQS